MSGYTLSGSTCIKCPPQCATCNFATALAKTTCTACDAGYILSDGLCVACATNCKSCSAKGSGKCDPNECKSGFKLKDDFTACEACPDGCSFCTSLTTCVVGQCDAGYVMKSDGTCKKCPVGCAVCTLSTDGNTATCVSGKCQQHYVQDAQRNCKPCPQGCISCYLDETTVKCAINGCTAKFGLDSTDASCAGRLIVHNT
ncbi:hypothetical protein NP493_1162g01025 [Ridgeia piscesae]|uniref:EGF-like domain-containing protein n=1 Tax=Ridgeia piscesae TaxID=27915 RepID=A0AAD9NIE6_RIDPI|nr:hypothetical protein NP493_1162g01025 [Ridgeia piscesae]